MDRLAAMETFVRVIESGSFSAAARLLRVGQPAVSKTVAQLEERLGVKLLARSTRGLTATEAGQNFYDRARRVLEDADEADLVARGAGTGLTGRLRVSAAVTFASLHVVPRLPEFLAAHPGLDIEVVLDDRNIDLVHGGIDVALRMGELADSALAARRIGRAPRLVVGTPAYWKKAGIPRVPVDLLAHDHVTYSPGGAGEAWTFRKGGEQSTVTLRGRLSFSAAEGVRAAVLAHGGVAVGSRWMFSPELAAGRLKPVLADWELPPTDLWAVLPAGRVASTKARTFIAFVEQMLTDSASG